MPHVLSHKWKKKTKKKAIDSSRRGSAEKSEGCGGVGGKGRRIGKHDQTAYIVISTTWIPNGENYCKERDVSKRLAVPPENNFFFGIFSFKEKCSKWHEIFNFFKKLRQVDCCELQRQSHSKFEASPGYRVRPYLKNKYKSYNYETWLEWNKYSHVLLWWCFGKWQIAIW